METLLTKDAARTVPADGNCPNCVGRIVRGVCGNCGLGTVHKPFMAACPLCDTVQADGQGCRCGNLQPSKAKRLELLTAKLVIAHSQVCEAKELLKARENTLADAVADVRAAAVEAGQ